MISKNNNLIDDGFTFVNNVFTQKDILNSKNAFWDVINCKYDTGVNPENRFWNLGEDPKKIIKIDKEIHRDMKETGEKLSMYLLLTTIGVALIVLSTMVTCIVYWEKFVSVEQAAATGVASNTTSILISNNTGANANVATTKDIGDCMSHVFL